jgi:uncharacterized protein YuzE
MRLHVDKEADALYLRLDDSKIIESEEIAPGVIVDYDRKNAVVGVEVLHLSRRTTKSRARKHPASRTTAALVLHEKPARKYGKSAR